MAAEPVELRRALPGEREALRELHRRSSLVWPEDRAVLEAHPELFGVAPEAIAERRVRVAVGRGAELLGFSVVADGGPGAWELEDLFVEPRVMRRGIGTALVQDAASRAWGSGCARMTVTAHPRTIPFYARLGFAVTGPAETRFGPAVRLVLEAGRPA